MPRQPAKKSLPFWHRARLGWVNSLGFALTVIYAGWLMLTVFRTIMPKSDPLEFTIPAVYVGVTLLALLANVLACGLVLSHAWRGGDFREPRAHLHVLWWSISGVALFLVLALVVVKFGNEPIPNVAPWASTMFWRGCVIGLPAFALMTYVNSTGHAPNSYADDDYADEYLEEAYDEA